jgi:ribosomal protein L34E
MTKSIIKKRSPGGRLLLHKTKKKKSPSHCRVCGVKLPTNKNTKTKSGKKVARPLSGELCHACLRSSLQLAELK